LCEKQSLLTPHEVFPQKALEKLHRLRDGWVFANYLFKDLSKTAVKMVRVRMIAVGDSPCSMSCLRLE
jgi:hypothetical protein